MKSSQHSFGTRDDPKSVDDTLAGQPQNTVRMASHLKLAGISTAIPVAEKRSIVLEDSTESFCPFVQIDDLLVPTGERVFQLRPQ